MQSLRSDSPSWKRNASTRNSCSIVIQACSIYKEKNYVIMYIQIGGLKLLKREKKAVSMNGHNRLRMSCQKKRFMLTAGQTSNHDRSRLEQQILLVILLAFLPIVRCNKEKKKIPTLKIKANTSKLMLRRIKLGGISPIST